MHPETKKLKQKTRPI